MSQRVYITVDMETPQTPLRKGILKESLFNYKGEYDTILNICHFYNIPATFFLDIYEEEIWGKGFFYNKCENILNKGSDVQLHTHPSWKYDIQRINMYDYSLEEQNDIINWGKEKLQEMTGRKIVVHRAGAYGADINTLYALKENNIFIDSSFFFNHENCRLNQYSLNDLAKTEVYQIEVLTFTKTLKNSRRLLKFDIDWMDLCELLTVVDIITQKNVENVILFMHSSSFIKHNNEYTRLEVDYYKLYKFAAVIEYMMDLGYVFTTMKEDIDSIKESWCHLKFELENTTFIRKKMRFNRMNNLRIQSHSVEELHHYIEKNERRLAMKLYKESFHHFIRNEMMSYFGSSCS